MDIFTVPVVSSTPMNTEEFADFGDFTGAQSNFGDFSAPVNTSSDVSRLNPDNQLSQGNHDLRKGLQATLPIASSKPMTADHLEAVSMVLYDGGYLSLALACCNQCLYVREVVNLSARKVEAVENDDLELAIRLRDEINSSKEKLVSVTEEQNWLKVAVNAPANKIIEGSGIKESVDLIELLDSSIAKKAKEMFLGKGFSMSRHYGGSNDQRTSATGAAILLDEITTSLSIKRSLHMIVANLTSHKNYPTYWKKIMTQINYIIDGAIEKIDSFKRLSDLERAAVLGEEKMNNFLRGISRVSKLGMWVAVTCLETLVELDLAHRIIALCSKFTKLASATWESFSKEVINISCSQYFCV